LKTQRAYGDANQMQMQMQHPQPSPSIILMLMLMLRMLRMLQCCNAALMLLLSPFFDFVCDFIFLLYLSVSLSFSFRMVAGATVANKRAYRGI
jgi:hypothetical protein